MKYLFFVIILVFCTSFKLPSTDITIEISNLRNSKGAVLVSIFNNQNDFPQNAENAVYKSKVKITGKAVLVTFSNIPPGNYAAAILHDENDNLKMDFNFLGIPKEGYGFSNNAKGFMGPPSFSKAAFRVDNVSKKISINAIYF